MLIIYFLLGLSLATGHSDYGVSFRAKNFDETVKNINILSHQRLKRFVKSYYKQQNVSKHQKTWGNSNLARNNVSATTNYVNPGQTYYNINVTKPGYPNSNNSFVRPIYNNANTSQPLNPVTPGYAPYPGFNPGYPGYPAPNTVYPPPKPSYPEPNGSPWAIQGYYNATNGSYPIPNTGSLVFPKPVVYPASNSSYTNPNTGFQVPNNSYPAPNVYPAPNTVYPKPNNGYPAPNNSYPKPNVYPAPSNVYPRPNNGYPAPNNSYPKPNIYPAPNNIYPHPAPNTNYPNPNTGFYLPNTTYTVPNTNYTKPNTGFQVPNGYPNSNTGFNNTASLACKCPLPRANSTITKEERTMDACMIACNNCPYGMKMTAYGICVRDEEDE